MIEDKALSTEVKITPIQPDKSAKVPFSFHEMIEANEQGQTSVIKPKLRVEINTMKVFLQELNRKKC
jgi:hypothetical protein